MIAAPGAAGLAFLVRKRGMTVPQATFINGARLDEYILLNRNSTKYWYMESAIIGNVAALVNSSGSIQEGYTYRGYGQATVHTGAGNDGVWFTSDDATATSSALGNPYLFTGRDWDSTISLQYNRARWYAPVPGRWLSRDPLGYTDGLNLYDYVRSRAPALQDPWGLWGRDLHYSWTFTMAVKAGISCPEAFAAGAQQPDEDWRRAGEEGIGDVLSLCREGKWSEAGAKWALMAEWHFPVSADGWVWPGSPEAWEKAKRGKDTCDLTLFSEGLHVLQDSYAHRGKPPVFGIGHYWDDGSNLPACLTHDADEIQKFPAYARAAIKATYEALVAFKYACPCHCPGGRPTSVGDEVPPRYINQGLLEVIPNNPP